MPFSIFSFIKDFWDSKIIGGELTQQIDEVFHRNGRTAQDRPQSSSIQFLVIGNHHLGKRFIAAKNHVASFLAAQSKARLPQRPHAVAS